MKRVIFIIAVLLLLPSHAFALPEIKPTFPRLANYFLHWTISEEEARALAKFDLVILDAEVQERSRAELQMLRALNPNLLLLAYVPASEVRRDTASLRDIAPLRFRLGSNLPEEAYLHDASGSRRSFWSGTWIVNVSNEAPQALGGKRWNEYLPEFVATEILSTGLWDGVFYDNAWDEIVHFARGVPDLNGDGAQDDATEANRKWQEGLRTLYGNTIARAQNKLVAENDGVIYASAVHGVLLENFPRKGWSRYIQDLHTIRSSANNPALPILNATTFNSGQRDSWRAMRFGLTTALLADSYYSFDFGDQDHGQTWLYDEYDAFLGEPLRDKVTRRRDLTTRDFENGIVLLNSGEAAQTVELSIEVEKIRGTQDPAVNDGLITRELTIGALDGLIVLRPLRTISGAPFENGVFARVFNARGEAVRAGFFAFEKRERSGLIIASADLDGDDKLDKIKREDMFALGDVTGDGVKEIVSGYGGQIRIQRFDGTLVVLPFFPFGPRYRGNLSVGVGDLNGDGFSEIVVGAGAGGGPQVRIFSREGKLLSGGFFAYDPRFRGGVRVAVGDVDGDGIAEIVTGPGPGGGPQIRTFDGKGRPKGAAFFGFDRSSRAGVTPIVADVDGDGGNEIIAVTKDVL